MARHAIHPDDHSDDEYGGQEQEKPLETVFTDFPAVESNGGGQAESGSQPDTAPDESDQARSACTLEVDENNTDHQGGFDTLTESDQKGRDQVGDPSCKPVATPKLEFSCFAPLGQGI